MCLYVKVVESKLAIFELVWYFENCSRSLRNNNEILFDIVFVYKKNEIWSKNILIYVIMLRKCDFYDKKVCLN